jgi:hypothetical protein
MGIFFKAEEITLTIGQAFDLAYRRFLESSGREVEGRRQVSQLQEKLDNVEHQNQVLRRRLLELSNLVDNNKLAGFLETEGVNKRVLVHLVVVGRQLLVLQFVVVRVRELTSNDA